MGLHKFIQVAPYVECNGKTHLENVFLDIIENKGEGIILRLPNASHKGGRTSDYLKFKVLLAPISYTCYNRYFISCIIFIII